MSVAADTVTGVASSRAVPVPVAWENGAAAAAPPDLTDSMAARITESMSASRADGTLRAYASAWRRFADWCSRNGHIALPAHPATVAAYLVDAADTVTPDDKPAYAPATLSKWVAAIAYVHRRSGHTSPTNHETVRATLSGIRRTIASSGDRPRKQMNPLLAEPTRSLRDFSPSSTPKPDNGEAPDLARSGAFVCG